MDKETARRLILDMRSLILNSLAIFLLYAPPFYDFMTKKGLKTLIYLDPLQLEMDKECKIYHYVISHKR